MSIRVAMHVLLYKTLLIYRQKFVMDEDPIPPEVRFQAGSSSSATAFSVGCSESTEEAVSLQESFLKYRKLRQVS